MDMILRKETQSRRLPCRLREHEKIDRCRELAGAVEQAAEADQRHDLAKERTKDAKKAADERHGRVAAISRVISSGTEIRDAECETILDYGGKVVVTMRTDTRAVVSVRNMTDAELQTEVFEDGSAADMDEVRAAVELFRRRGGDTAEAIADAVEKIRPKPGSGIDSVTISHKDQSVTHADGRTEAADGEEQP